MNNINEKITKEHFDNIAINYSVNEHKGNTDKFEVIQEVMISSEKAPNILECGGGGGFYTLKFLKLGFKVTTIDLSEEALHINKTNAIKEGLGEHLNVIAGNYNDIVPTINNKFSQIVFIKVLHHYNNLEEIINAIEISYHKLENNGRLLIFEPNGKNIFWKVFLKLSKDKITGKSKWQFEKNLELTTVSNLISFFKNNNIEFQVKYKYVIPAFLMQKNGILQKFLIKINNILEKTIFKYFAYNILIYVDKNDY